MKKQNRKLIEYVGHFGILSVKQLSIQNQRSDQLIRRDVRGLLDQNILLTRQRPYGSHPGTAQTNRDATPGHNPQRFWISLRGRPQRHENGAPRFWNWRRISSHELG